MSRDLTLITVLLYLVTSQKCELTSPVDCSPNLKKHRHKRGINFYTTRDVNTDEELCISYVDVCPGASMIDRKTELENDWFFVCQCARCVRDSNVGIDLRTRD